MVGGMKDSFPTGKYNLSIPPEEEGQHSHLDERGIGMRAGKRQTIWKSAKMFLVQVST
jgi:hypothetical protein